MMSEEHISASLAKRRRRYCSHLTVDLLALGLLVSSSQVTAESNPWTATLYGARISSEPGWEDILLNAVGVKFVDSFLVTGALSRPYVHFSNGALALEGEGQVAYNFGEQDHWEFNLVPIVVRWQRFPWSYRVETSAAFGLGLSYATELPEVEVELEGESQQLLIYWVAELTAGPVLTPWAITLRIHHRSVAWGVMGDEGGITSPLQIWRPELSHPPRAAVTAIQSMTVDAGVLIG